MSLTPNPLRLNRLYLVLAAIFLTNAIVAEFGGVKIFSLDKLLGIDLSSFSPSGNGVNMSVGVLIWPLVFVFSDIINEYFGRKGVRLISYLTAIMIAYCFIIIWMWTSMPAADFWLQLNGFDNLGRPFDIDFAYAKIFRSGLGIIVGSLTAFLISQLIDAYVFHWLKGLTGHKWLWLRATGSTAVSQLIDSFVILFIAFYLLGNWSMQQVVNVGITQYFYKIFLAIALTPLIYLVHQITDAYLGAGHAVQTNDKQ